MTNTYIALFYNIFIFRNKALNHIIKGFIMIYAIILSLLSATLIYILAVEIFFDFYSFSSPKDRFKSDFLRRKNIFSSKHD